MLGRCGTRFGVQEGMHWPSKLRICKGREGRGLCCVSGGEPCSMGLWLAQAPAETRPLCHSFIHARCHGRTIIFRRAAPSCALVARRYHGTLGPLRHGTCSFYFLFLCVCVCVYLRMRRLVTASQSSGNLPVSLRESES